MNTNLDKKIEEAIKANLPAQVGETLQKELAKIPTLLQRVEDLERALEAKTNQSEKDSLTIDDYKEKLNKYVGIEARESALKDAERALKIEKLEYQLEAEKSKTSHAVALGLGLVRNTEFRSSLFHSQDPGGLPTYDGQGNPHYPTECVTQHQESREAL